MYFVLTLGCISQQTDIYYFVGSLVFLLKQELFLKAGQSEPTLNFNIFYI